MMRVLLDRKFIMEDKRKDVPGKPMMYKTTKEFLEFMKQIKVPKTSNIYYDSADAERGNLLLQAGYTGFKAKKNINAGISYVKGFDIVVDSGGPYGQNAMDEVQGYTGLHYGIV